MVGGLLLNDSTKNDHRLIIDWLGGEWLLLTPRMVVDFIIILIVYDKSWLHCDREANHAEEMLFQMVTGS